MSQRRAQHLRLVRAAFAAIAMLALAAPRSFADEAQRTMTVSELPPPDLAADASAAREDYVIGPLDTLEVKVYPDATLGGDIRVDASGNIEIPLAGQISAAGKTPHQVAEIMTAKLAEKYFESPSVVVSVKESVTNRYTVAGAVTKPGIFDVDAKTTLMQAVAQAGGVNEYANERDVVIFRTVHQKHAAAVVNLTMVMRGQIEDPQIYPGDTVVVATSASKRVLHQIIQATPLLILLQPFGL